MKQQLMRLQRLGIRMSEGAARYAAAAAEAAPRRGALWLSLLVTLLFYFPALRESARNAGFIYTGDVLGFYWPSLVKLHALLSNWNFDAVDFSLFNGSSDFFLTSNFFGVHPWFVLHALLTPAAKVTQWHVAKVLVIACAVHTFLACYFSLRLLKEFFGLPFWMAAFVAIGFGFSLYQVNYLGEPMFIFCASAMAWSAHAALVFERERTLRRFVLAVLPPLIGFLGGYIPIGAVSVGFGVLLVGARIFLFDPSPVAAAQRIRTFAVAMAPFAAASLLVGPYLLGLYLYLKETPSALVPSLFFSAHQLADLPQSILRLISGRFVQPGPHYEASMHWGMVGVAIMVLFFVDRQRALLTLTAADWRLLKLSAVIYFVTVLSTFGEFSALADMVYYFVPQVGKMHIYQRFLIVTQLFFCLMLALMLKSVVQNRHTMPIGTLAAVFAISALVVSYLLGRHADWSREAGLNNWLVMELLFAFVFTMALAFAGERFIYTAAIVLFTLPVLDRMYEMSANPWRLEEQVHLHPAVLKDAERERLVQYLRRFSDKDLVKYVDITPMWAGPGVETFYKNFPYFVLKEIRLSSYHGFNFYLSPRLHYMELNPVQGMNELSPDWEWVAQGGADFIVARESDIAGGIVKAVAGDVPEADMYRLPRGVVLVPLRAAKQGAAKNATDNGFFRVTARTAAAMPRNMALGKPTRQSSTGAQGPAALAVDGNTDGNFAAGSVARTQAVVNAWWEVDLGAAETIESVVVWNQSDCCVQRVDRFWVFISEEPFRSNDTAETLRARPHTWAGIIPPPKAKGQVRVPTVRGRYVRVQLDGRAQPGGVTLSLAEVQVFSPAPPANTSAAPRIVGFYTNDANRVRVEVESPVPASVQYLLSDNPRFRYYVNGARIKPTRDRLRVTIDLPAGRNVVEIRYRHWLLRLFWVGYALFGLLLAWALLAPLAHAWRARARRRTRKLE
jgi:hypothetical protein